MRGRVDGLLPQHMAASAIERKYAKFFHVRCVTHAANLLLKDLGMIFIEQIALVFLPRN